MIWKREFRLDGEGVYCMTTGMYWRLEVEYRKRIHSVGKHEEGGFIARRLYFFDAKTGEVR